MFCFPPVGLILLQLQISELLIPILSLMHFHRSITESKFRTRKMYPIGVFAAR